MKTEANSAKSDSTAHPLKDRTKEENKDNSLSDKGCSTEKDAEVWDRSNKEISIQPKLLAICTRGRYTVIL